MTLQSELAEWKRKKAEADSNYAKDLPVREGKEYWGNAVRVAVENIHRIESVLQQSPWIDEIEAENMRHFKAEESIYAKYKM